MATRAKAAALAPVPAVSRWQVALAVVAAVVALAAFLGWRIHRDQSEHDGGLRLARQGHTQAAEPLLLSAYERNRQDADVVRALALGYLKDRRVAEAEVFVDRWCELLPDSVEPYRARLDLAMSQQKGAQAIAAAEQILRLQPNDSKTRQLTAQLLLLDGRASEAERAVLECMRARPDDVVLWHLLATAYQQKKRTVEATELAERIVRQAPKFFPGVRLRAELYAAAGQYEPAIALLRQAADQSGPEKVPALYELSLVLARAGREAEANKALADMRLIQALGLWEEDQQKDTNAALQARVVDAMRAAGKTDEASRFLNGILRRNPQAAGARQMLAGLNSSDKVTR